MLSVNGQVSGLWRNLAGIGETETPVCQAFSVCKDLQFLGVAFHILHC